MPNRASTDSSPKRAFLIMKIIAVALLAGIFAILTLHSKRDPHTTTAKLRSNALDLRPVSKRTFAENFSFAASNADGAQKAASLTDLRGQVVHLNFWTTWCEPCTREMPQIETLIQELSPSHYSAILINLDEDSKNQLDAKKMQMNLTPSAMTLFQNESALQPADLARKMNVEVIPYHVLIDKSGRIAAEFYTPLDKTFSEFKRLVLQLLAEEPEAGSSQ
ncbi:MAG: TlpA family protein disulfide reductase [Bdellovibrionales bacterium]|nr:TlpA family protein disulfide reductase [Bdellovibrionales bacterium]